MNNIQKAAKKYFKEIKKVDLPNIINHLKKIGYTVVFYNTPTGDEIMRVYGLEDKKQNRDAFTCCGTNIAKVIFVDNNLHNLDKVYLLLHEIGHILLGHIGNGQIAYMDKQGIEMEANAFAYEVLNYKSNSKTIFTIISTALISFTAGIVFSAKKKVVIKLPENDIEKKI